MAKVYACFWFDVEDYITPESDEALASLLRIFQERGATGTWKLVGEKYRVLRERGRSDIIAALHKQDVGYHTDNHSQHPTVSEYERGLGWEAGIAEFVARERRGLEELRQEFGSVSCYGQPGGAWAPQAFAGLGAMGIPMYLDEGRHLGLDNMPFWFANILTIFNLQQNCVRADIHAADKKGALADACRLFDAAAARLSTSGGVISVYYHPCEFATEEFWDGVNFSHGRNTPREQWRPARLCSPAEAEARLATFAGLLEHALASDQVEVVNAAELLAAFQSGKPAGPVPVSELAGVASAMGGSISYASSSQGRLSPAQLFSGMAEALAYWQEHGHLPEAVTPASPFGPSERAGSEEGGQATTCALGSAAREAVAEMAATGHMPNSLVLGSAQIGPATAFRAMAQALVSILAEPGARPCQAVTFDRGRLALEDRVGTDEREMWGWTIFPPGFSAPDLLELTRLQAWTIKPADLK